MTAIRQEFRDIVSGWTLVRSFDTLTEKIEELANWAKIPGNKPFTPDEEATLKLMIEYQIHLADEEGIS